jgi:S-adenosylmethionine decarboxylase
VCKELEKKEYETYGTHIVCDMWGVDFDKLDNIEYLSKITNDASLKCGATVLNLSAHKFDPSGVTVVIMLSESHLSFHSYPSFGYASLDVYTCGNEVDPNIAIEYIKNKLSPNYCNEIYLTRGHKHGIEEISREE